MAHQMLQAQSRHGDENSMAVSMEAREEAAFIGFFPHGKTGA